MLVLSRKASQSVQIGDHIRITIIKLERNAVRLGIEAPGDVTILREELLLNLDPEARDARAAWDASVPAPTPATTPTRMGRSC